jgi:hypothetical protein
MYVCILPAGTVVTWCLDVTSTHISPTGDYDLNGTTSEGYNQRI